MSFLTRSQVVAKFKLEVLPPILKDVGDDFTIIQYCWGLTLEQLEGSRQISATQKRKWKLKKIDLV
jgi:hypothetical protein